MSEVAKIAQLARAALPAPLPGDAVVSIEINRQLRLIITTASGDRFEVESRKESERIARTLAPASVKPIIPLPIGRKFYRSRTILMNGSVGLEFREPGRE